MIELKNDELHSVPDVHEDAVCRVDFQRRCAFLTTTGIIPAARFGARFSVEHVEDHSSRLPAAWVERGGSYFRCTRLRRCGLTFPVGAVPDGASVIRSH